MGKQEREKEVIYYIVTNFLKTSEGSGWSQEHIWNLDYLFFKPGPSSSQKRTTKNNKRESLNKFADFFLMGTFIDSTYIKL